MSLGGIEGQNPCLDEGLGAPCWTIVRLLAGGQSFFPSHLMFAVGGVILVNVHALPTYH